VLCLAELGRAGEALTDEQCAARILATQPVPGDQRQDCARFLALAYLVQGRPDEARATLGPVWPGVEATFPKQRPFYRLEWARAMRVYFRGLGDRARAEQCESWIRQEAMGDVDAAGLDTQPAGPVER
jgi:hypothetical protein